MKNSPILLAISVSLISGSALAGSMGTPISPAWVGTISAGPVWTSSGKTQTMDLTPAIRKAWVADNSSNVIFNGEVFGGIQKKLWGVVLGQLGLALAATSDASLSGRIWDNAVPRFNNYSYSYKIQHTHVAVKGKLLADTGFWLTPWISGSLGAGFNTAHSYDNTPTCCGAVQNDNFSSHTKTAFTYTLGAGIQKALNTHWQVGLGYEYADWGSSTLGRAAGQTLNTGLTDHLHTNGFLFNLTYVA